MERKIFNVYSFNLMKYLREKGFDFIGTKQDEKDFRKTIFYYEDSKALRAEVAAYTNNWKSKFMRG